MDLDELKNKWQTLSIRTDRLEKDNQILASKLASGRLSNIQNKLARMYRRNAITALILPAIAPAIVHVLDFKVWVAVLYATLGVLMSILNFLFLRKIKKHDYMSMPVVKALSQSVQLRKRQKQIKAVGICFGVIVILSLFSQVMNDNILYGLIAGLIVGIPIGYKKYRQSVDLTKQLQDEIRNCLHDKNTP